MSEPKKTDPRSGQSATAASDLRAGDRGVTPHSPGPWSACQDGACECGMVWDASEQCLVAVAQGELHLGLHGGEPDCVPLNNVQRANAHLIAAAPDLLEALKALVKATHDADNPCEMGVFSGDDVVKQAEVAIAKAEGKS